MKLPMLEISFYDGEYIGDAALLTKLCEIEGSVVPDGLPPYSELEETLRALEMCAERYSTPHPVSECFTVFIGRGTDAKVKPLMRLDVMAREGCASASVLSENRPCEDT
ncbi:hypothetical protein OKW43_005805 [Paraburkholderia sp. WC7.3g]|uniref:Uncharacterized protein n=1 Tax=Paraburkholderia podalyriae TaxID=1938811 RepID=A0ABR7PV88_9BURK|nr:hypothetical protein [Paraburkholderia podalyriae]MBC8750180.1 hypothetical protein [Paraburkholderia podalyriae]